MPFVWGKADSPLSLHRERLWAVCAINSPLFGFKIQWGQLREGSSPSFGTKDNSLNGMGLQKVRPARTPLRISCFHPPFTSLPCWQVMPQRPADIASSGRLLCDYKFNDSIVSGQLWYELHVLSEVEQIQSAWMPLRVSHPSLI